MDKPTTKEYYTIRSNLFNSIRGSLYGRAPTKLKDRSERSRITYMHVSLLSRLLYVYQIRYFLNVVHNIASCHRKKITTALSAWITFETMNEWNSCFHFITKMNCIYTIQWRPCISWFRDYQELSFL